MFTTEQVKEQINSYLSLLDVPRVAKKKNKPVVKIDTKEINDSIEQHFKKFKQLTDNEAKKMISDFAKDVCLAFDSIIRAFIHHLQSPENPIDINKFSGAYNGLKESFQTNYKNFFGIELDAIGEVFFDIDNSLKDLETEGQRLTELLNKPVLLTQTSTSQSVGRASTTSQPALNSTDKVEDKKSAAADDKPKKADGGSSSGGGFLKSIISKAFSKGDKKDDGFIKCKLEENTEAKWDPIKKKWIFAGEEDEPEPEPVKLPPKASDLAKKKAEEAEKKVQGGDEAKNGVPGESKVEDKEKSIVDSLLRPKGRVIDRNKGAKGQGQPVKVPKMAMKVFENIPAEPVMLTYEQRRELVTFELLDHLKHKLASVEAEQVDDEGLDEEEEIKQRDNFKILIHNFFEQSLHHAYFTAISSLQSKEEDSKHISPRLTLSQGTQTQPIRSSVSDPDSLPQVLNEKIKLLTNLLKEERAGWQMERHTTRQLLEHLTKLAANELKETDSQLDVHTKDPPQFFKNEDGLALAQIIRNMSAKLDTAHREVDRINQEKMKLMAYAELLMKDNEKKGMFIVELQKKFKEKQTKLYMQMKQAEIFSKEKEVLKKLAKDFFEESSHYQGECDKMCIELNKAVLQANHYQNTLNSYQNSVNKFLVSLKERIHTVHGNFFESSKTTEFVEDVNKQIQEYSKHILELVGVINEGTARYSHTLQLLYSMKCSRDSLVQQASEREKRVGNILAEQHQLINELEATKAKADQLETSLRLHEKKEKELHDELLQGKSTHTLEIKDLQENISKLTLDLESARQEILDLKDQCSAVDKLTLEKNQIQKLLDDERAYFTQQEEDSKAIKRQLEDENESLTNQVQALEADLIDTRKKLAESQQQYDDLIKSHEDEFLRLQNMLESKALEIKSIKSENEERMQKLESEIIERISQQNDEVVSNLNLKIEEQEGLKSAYEYQWEGLWAFIREKQDSVGIEHPEGENDVVRTITHLIENIYAKQAGVVKSLDERLEESESKVELLKVSIQKLEKEARDTQAELEEKNAAIKLIKEQANLSSSDLENTHKKTISDLEAKVNELKEMIASLEAKDSTNSQIITTIESSNQTLNHQLQEATQNINSLKTQLEEKVRELSAIDQKTLQKEEQSEPKLTQDQHIGTDNSSLLQELQEYKEKYSKLSDKADELASMIDSFRAKLAQAEQEKMELQEKLYQPTLNEPKQRETPKAAQVAPENRSTQEELVEKNAILTQSLSRATDRVKELEGVTEGLRILVKQKEQEIQSLRGGILTEVTTLPHAQAEEVEALERKVELLTMDLSEANKAIDDYRAEREELKERVLAEVRTAAGTNRDAQELLRLLFEEKKK
jgi:hypothetical protein